MQAEVGAGSGASADKVTAAINAVAQDTGHETVGGKVRNEVYFTFKGNENPLIPQILYFQVLRCF